MTFRIIRTLGKSGVQNSPTTTGQEMALSRRHSGLVLPEFQDQVHNGNIFQLQRGSATGPISFVKTAYDADQPQLVIDVPVGTTIIPLNLEVVLEDAAGTDNEIIWGYANALVGAGTSTTITRTSAASNYRSMLVNASATEPDSNCTIYRDYTGNGTDVTSAGAFMELTRFVDAFAQEADARSKFEWNYLVNGPAPVIEGTGSLVLWLAAASTAASGFVRASWAEFSTS